MMTMIAGSMKCESIQAHLRIAELELEEARRDKRHSYNYCCFHSQQAAEHAVKALLLAVSGGFDYSHRIRALLIDAVNAGVGVPGEVFAAAERLEPHYMASRYPEVTGAIYCETACQVAWDVYSYDDAKDCLEDAETILEWVRRELRERQMMEP